MEYQEYHPQGVIKEYINKFWYVKAELGYKTEKIFPQPLIFLIINLGEPYKLFLDPELKRYEIKADSWISGLQNKYLTIENPKISHNVGIEFNPGCLPFFTEYPQNDLSNKVIDLGPVFQESFAGIRNLSRKKGGPEVLFKELEEILEKLYRAKDLKGFKQVQKGIKIISENQEIKISEVAKELNISDKHLHQIFNKFTGASPKKLKDIYKFQSLINLIGTKKPESWAEIAATFNYYDQPHFVKVFKSFTGLTPNEYINVLNKKDSGYRNYLAMD